MEKSDKNKEKAIEVGEEGEEVEMDGVRRGDVWMQSVGVGGGGQHMTGRRVEE